MNKAETHEQNLAEEYKSSKVILTFRKALHRSDVGFEVLITVINTPQQLKEFNLEDIERNMTSSNQLNANSSISLTTASKPPQVPRLTITLDDGYSCFIDRHAITFMNEIRYIRTAVRAQHPGPSGYRVHIPGVRRDLWLSIQQSIISGKVKNVSTPAYYKGRNEMAQVGKQDLRMGPWDVHIHQLIELIIIGEHLDAPFFENAVMVKLIWTYREFFQHYEGRVPLGNVEYVFANTVNPYLRRFMLDCLIFAMSNKSAEIAIMDGHLSEELAEKMIARGNMTMDQVRDAPWDHPGDYHQKHC